MTGKEFEDIVARVCRAYRDKGTASIGRYGVQAIRTSPTDIVTIRSLPDFEGPVSGSGTQYIFDCKVCSQASFDLSAFRDKKKRQLDHMIERSRYGATCAFLIHWNARKLKTKHESLETWWFPVYWHSKFWDAFEHGEVRRITRADCYEYGKEVDWQKNKPNLIKLFNSI